MSFSRLFVIFALILFIVIGVAAWVKKQGKSSDTPDKTVSKSVPGSSVEIELNQAAKSKESSSIKKIDQKNSLKKEPVLIVFSKNPLSEVDRVQELFDVDQNKLDAFVETVTYKARVSWMQGRSAWLGDYATHYATSKHFIARSLNRKVDYLTQKVAEGDRFNVLRKEVEFFLLVDISCSKMFFYALDKQENKRVLLKTYDVGLGRLDSNSPSGCLTPLGKYSLGSKVVTYKPGSMGLFHHETTEMIRVFGTRWIPFDKELEGTTAPARGYGIHGAPWTNVNVDGKKGELLENIECISKYESDGCIRLATKDIEELYAIVITKPTTVQIVKNFNDVRLPGVEDVTKAESATK
ncbi:MAG: L,D-transpeptidase [Chlamydiales bacterium]|nr:L,D-transpeptidase [Chlamydiales bacterium]